MTPHPLVLLSTEMVVAPPEGESEDTTVDQSTVGDDVSDDDGESGEDEGEVR